MRVRDFQEFMEHCRPIKKLAADRTLIQIDETKQYIVIKSIEIDTANSQILASVLKDQKQLFHDHLLTVIDFCLTSNSEIQALIDYCTHSLMDEFQTRRKLKNSFTLHELQNILVSVLRALQYLEENSVAHGCISLIDIYVSENGAIKLADPSLASNSPLNLTQSYFYSPELISYNYKRQNESSMKDPLLFAKRAISKIDFFQSDIFCLGMLILQLGLLSKYERISHNCQSFQEGIIHFQILQNLLNEFEELYGSVLTNLLSRMLQESPQTRATPSEILEILEEEFEESVENSKESMERSRNINSVGAQYLNDGDDFSEPNYSQINNKTVNSFLLSRATANNISKDDSIEDNELLMKCENESSQESILLDNPISLIPNKKSLSQNSFLGKSQDENCSGNSYINLNLEAADKSVVELMDLPPVFGKTQRKSGIIQKENKKPLIRI